MSKKLELDVIKVGDTGLSVRVVHQCESLRSKGKLYYRSPFSLRSNFNPELMPVDLYINGRDVDVDGLTVSRVFLSKADRDDMYAFIMEALEYINKKEREIVRMYELVGVICWYSDDGKLAISSSGVVDGRTTATSECIRTGRYIDIDMETGKPIDGVKME